MSNIIKALPGSEGIVYDITQNTIRAVYPHYYPAGAVEFFCQHHSMENILRDIESGEVWLLYTQTGVPAGTVTVNGNEINRLFVLQKFQGNGYGRILMDFAEELVSQSFDSAELSASLPAKQIYISRGYKTVSYNIIDASDGDKLCYDYMVKHFVSKGGTE
ncbi:MAG: GNAT family N-acetyltransferase [Ruminococcus sp.]|nr:GNAT family N-acetyltransferase [Ruminococcus sp.]